MVPLRKGLLVALACLTACAAPAQPAAPMGPAGMPQGAPGNAPMMPVWGGGAGFGERGFGGPGAPPGPGPGHVARGLGEVDAAPSPIDARKVPVGSSPVRGNAAAPVTMVMFADLECPFCIRAEATVAALRERYGDRLRVVWKNNPLPIHRQAEPAAELCLEARAQKGDDAFWQVHDRVVTQAGMLEMSDLEAVAKAAGLDVPRAMKAIAARQHRAVIEDDQDLADELDAPSTPTFFINGHMLEGAQPIEVFVAQIDAELKQAAALVARGIAPAKLYETLQQGARGESPPEIRVVPPPTPQSPSRGPETAKVLIHLFGDYECPFCARVDPIVDALDAGFPGALRFVWHNLPLVMHPHAELAAEAAVEAFAQKGNPGFWAMHQQLFSHQRAPGGLERPALDAYAAAVGLDPARFAAALDGGVHRAAVHAEVTMAEQARIDGTPGFVINGVYISGALPLPHFRRIVKRALAEAK
ncbi:MAG: thioredoxin domain-containing protein [Byssovorax sp.]